MTREDVGRLAREAALEELPALLGTLEEAKAAAWARLASPLPAPTPLVAASTPARMLSADEAAAFAGVSKRWLLRHTRNVRFRHDLSRKQARFEEPGLRRWILARGCRATPQ